MLLALVKLPVLVLPESNLLPDQAPEAVHEVASTEAQLSVDASPLLMIVGLAINVTVGTPIVLLSLSSLLVSLQPKRNKYTNATAVKRHHAP